MSNTNQQAGATGPAVAQRDSLASAPVKDGKGTLEKTYSQADVDKLQTEIDRLKGENERIDTARRGVQSKLTKMEKDHKELQDNLDSAVANNKSLEETLKETHTEESARNAVRELAKNAAELKRREDKFKKDKDEAFAVIDDKLVKPVREKLAADYGCPIDLLEGITDPNELEVAAIKNRTKLPEVKAPEAANDNVIGKAPETKNEPPFMPGSAGGDDWHSLPADDKIQRGLEKLFRK
jgi:Skp family chaperone for outer membrane proteins